MTDTLLIALIVVLAGGGVGAAVFANRTRAGLDRRLKRMEQRLDDLLVRPHPSESIASVGDAFDRQQRILTEELRADLADLATRLLSRIDERTASIRPGKQSVEQRTRRAVAQDIHALLGLHGALPLERESLVLSGYAAAPDTILHLTTLVAGLPDDALVVEFGSGLSTVWMAAAARRHGRGIRIVSIDHDERWGEETVAALDRLELGGVAEVRIAPLEPLPGATENDAHWYALRALDGLEGIHLLVVDGPPAATGTGARYPAVPQLADRLAAECRIVLDDTDREEERAIAERWLGELGESRDARVERVLDRTTVLRLGPTRG